jgi:carbamoyl-phosphate synthase small subunit
MSLQYHPEASPGPHDSHYLFDDFLEMVAQERGLTLPKKSVQPATVTA